MNEFRSLELGELRAIASGETLKLAGYAAVFNQTTSIGGKFNERFAPGAFRQSIQTDDVRALFNHNPANLLGRKSAGTLRLSEDSHGLAVEIDLPRTSLGRDVAHLVERRDLQGMSFSFDSIEEDWDQKQNLRTVRKAKLYEVSPVTFPAYEGTSLQMRSAEQVLASRTARSAQDEFEILRLAIDLERIRF